MVIMSTENKSITSSDVLASIFTSRAVAQILDFFLDHKEFDYPITEIAEKTGLSFRTVFREIPSLERNHLIYKYRKVGKANMYKLNTDFEAVVLLERFALEVSQLQPMKEKTSITSDSDISEPEISLSE
jgi:DNA-binding transcriptional ArsR family regulator